MDLVKRDDGFPDQGPAIIGVSTGLLGLAIVLVIVRLAYRIRTRAVGPDDYLVILSVILSAGHSVTDIYSVRVWGYGRHKENLTPDQASAPGQALGFWLAQLMYKLVVALTKLSICFLYFRIFQRANRAWLIALYCVIGLVTAYYLGAWVATVFQCVPVPATWVKSIQGRCINVTLFFYVNAGFNILTDVCIMALPVPVIRALKLPGRQKIALCLVFAVGLIATATSIVRIFTLNVSTQGSDPTWEIGGSTLWSSAEINTAIVCACLPVLKGPLQAIAPRLFGSRGSRARSHTGRSEGTYGSEEGRTPGPTVSGGSDDTRVDDDVTSVQELHPRRPATMHFSDGARLGSLWEDKPRDSGSMFAIEGAAENGDGRTLRGRGNNGVESAGGESASDEARSGIVKSIGYKVSFEKNSDGSSGISEPKGIAL